MDPRAMTNCSDVYLTNNFTTKTFSSCGSNASDEQIHVLAAAQTSISAYIVPIIFGIIFLVGVLGNGTLIFTVIRNKPMRNVPNIYIVSLAIGDLLLILISVPFSATIYTITVWPFGDTICKFSYFMQTLSLGVSVFTLTALSGDRYWVIVKPMSKHMGNPTFRTYCVAITIWVFSAFLAIPDALSAKEILDQDHNNPNAPYLTICLQYGRPNDWPAWYPKAHALVRFCLYFALPVLIIGFFYAMMAHILMLSGHLMPGDGEMKHTQQRQIAARKKVAKIVLSFVVIFIVCWFPRHIYMLWVHYDPSEYNAFWHVFKMVGFCLCFMNSCVNPMALYFLSRQFRKHYNEYLFCWCYRSRYSPMNQSSAAMYNFNSTVRQTSTNTTMMHSQSMC